MQSESGIKLLRNQFTGERCWLIGSGPSLKELDLSLIKGEYTCGVNGTHLVADQIGLPLPYTFYGMKETSAFQQYGLSAGGAAYKFDCLWSRNLIPDPSWIKMSRVASMTSGTFTGILPDCQSVATAPGILYELLQPLYWLGFSAVYMIGCEESGDEKVDGSRTHVSRLEDTERAAAVALKHFVADGRVLRNLTPSTALQAIPRGDYEGTVRKPQE